MLKKIGMAGPISIDMLHDLVDMRGENIVGYRFSPMSEWVREVIGYGIKVVFFTTSPDIRDVRRYIGKDLELIVIPQVRGKLARTVRGFKREINQISAEIDKSDVQIIHAHWIYEFSAAAIRSNKIALITSHDSPRNVIEFSDIKEKLYRTRRFFLAVSNLRRTSNLTVVSPYVASEIKKLGYSGKIEVIPNGLSESIFKYNPPESKNEAIVFASTLIGWGKRKNARTLIEAFSIVKKQLPNSRLILFGQGHGLNEQGYEWAKSKGMLAGIDFLGATQYASLISIMSSEVDIYVHPALEEANPVAVLEAMALGKPIIGGIKSGGVPSTLANGEAGILTDVSNPEILAQQMLELALDLDKRIFYSKKAYEYALHNYKSSIVWSRYLNFYKRILLESENSEKDIK